jgi:YfiH family protein
MKSFPSPPFWLQAAGWDQVPGLVHGFSGRLPDRAALPGFDGEGLSLRTVKQVHGDTVVVISRSDHEHDRPEADGMITAEPGMGLGIATADCVPVLLVAPEHGVVGAVHAGWRGTLKGICVRAIEKLTTEWSVDPQCLWVAVGPAIDRCCYEVGREVGEALCQQWQIPQPAAWQPHGEKGVLDLRLINLIQCARAGVPRDHLQVVGPCTFCDAHHFASYRREGARAGRQLSVVGWRRNRESSERVITNCY